MLTFYWIDSSSYLDWRRFPHRPRVYVEWGEEGKEDKTFQKIIQTHWAPKNFLKYHKTGEI